MRRGTRAGRRRIGRRRRINRRRFRLGRKVPLVHRFKEVVLHDQSISAGAGSAGFGQLYFHANETTNWPSLRNLFDLYKITGVKVKIIPYFNTGMVETTNAGATAGALPTLIVAPNRDPYVGAPASYADVLNDDGVRTFQVSKPITLWLKSPKANIVTEAPEGGAPLDMPFQFGVGSKWQPWLTTGGNSQLIDQSGLAHYGFRYALSNPGGVPVTMNTFVTYYITLKEQD